VAPSYVRWDMTVGYQINKDIQLRLKPINLTDELYFDGVNPSHIIPGAGRTIIGTAIFNFAADRGHAIPSSHRHGGDALPEPTR
jgi:outer membrane receptor for monomeric catechols